MISPRKPARRLAVSDHDRSVVGMTYVYPVVSRRAGGVSLGINLNPNRACNWRCVYCQVPGLVRGKGPAIDLALLAAELDAMLEALVHGRFFAESVPPEARRLTDIALSGDGEPTTSPDFTAVLGVVQAALERFDLRGTIEVVLITNGSMVHRPAVQAALGRLAAMNGVVWFKLDSATAAGARRINDSRSSPARHLDKLRTAAERCPTWLQTCWFLWGGAPPSDAEQRAYLDALARLVKGGVHLAGVHLYTLARPSQQPEASALGPLPSAWLEAFARRIEALGLRVKVSA